MFAQGDEEWVPVADSSAGFHVGGDLADVLSQKSHHLGVFARGHAGDAVGSFFDGADDGLVVIEEAVDPFAKLAVGASTLSAHATRLSVSTAVSTAVSTSVSASVSSSTCAPSTLSFALGVDVGPFVSGFRAGGV